MQGNVMWVESILTTAEWREMSQKYTTYDSNIPTPFFDSEFKWRKDMGSFLSNDEIQLINTRIDAVLKKAGIL